MTNLWPKQTRFIEEYLADSNATRAALAAGYSQKSAQAQSTRLLRHPLICAELALRRAAIAEKLEITAKYVVNSLRELADNRDNPASVRVAALSQIAKYTGGFVERHAVEAVVVHTVFNFVKPEAIEHETLPEALPEADPSE